jgi:uncharacterized protein
MLVVMAKRPGKSAKTRLSSVLSEAYRTQLAEGFLRDKAAQLELLGRPYAVAVAPPDRPESVRPLLGARAMLLAQEGPDLGARLLSAAQAAFAQGAAWVALIDADTPTLPIAYLEEACAALDAGASMALGPAWDGGYYLIGFAKTASYHPCFAQMPWSTSAVFETTYRRAHDAGISPHVLPAWYDVDTPNDLARLADELRYARPAARGFPHSTVAVLRERTACCGKCMRFWLARAVAHPSVA